MHVLLKGLVYGSPLTIRTKYEQQFAFTDTLTLACLRPGLDELDMVASVVAFGTYSPVGMDRISSDPRIVANPSHS